MDEKLEKLEQLLVQLVDAHEKMLALITRKRVAVRHADQVQVGECCQLENQQIQLIGELEKQRLQAVASLTLDVDRKAKQPMQLEQLALALDEPWRTKLLTLRLQLRKRMSQTRQELAVTQKATQSLVKHMQGLVQTVTAACQGTATYGRQGQAPRAAMKVSTFSATA